MLAVIAVISPTAQSIGDAIGGVSDDALLLLPIALAAGLAMWGAPVLIRFGKRIFGAAR